MAAKWCTVFLLAFLVGSMVAIVDVKTSEADSCYAGCGAYCSGWPPNICLGGAACGGTGCSCYTAGSCDDQCCGAVACARTCPPDFQVVTIVANCSCKNC
jgi:hypothetical protein